MTGVNCCGGMRVFGLWRQNIVETLSMIDVSVIINASSFLFLCVIVHHFGWLSFWQPINMPGRSHTMPEDKEVWNQVEAAFGVHPCLWQICVIHAVLAGDNVITIAPTGLGKLLTYWMPLLYIKHGIVVGVTPLKQLGAQFTEMLQDQGINSVSITASNATNELFKVASFSFLPWLSMMLVCCAICSESESQ